MTLASTKLIPELQYWFHDFVTSSSVNKYQVLFPATVNSFSLPQNSFIELLFNESYSKTSYNYLFTEVVKTLWPNIVTQRLSVYPISGKYYSCDETGENLFLLESEDRTLLDALLQYRIDSTSVTIIDSTSVSFVSNILYGNYSLLSTTLSKLIFIYLELKINSNISNYNSQVLLSNSTNILENVYETFVLDKIFDFLSSRGI